MGELIRTHKMTIDLQTYLRKSDGERVLWYYKDGLYWMVLEDEETIAILEERKDGYETRDRHSAENHQ